MVGICITAFLALSGQATVAFPLDYYTADELAQRLSEPSVKYVPDSSLEADVYLLSLPAAPIDSQVRLLSDGLGLDIGRTGDKRSIRPSTVVLRKRERLQYRLIQNSVDEFQDRIHTTSDAVVKGSLPDFAGLKRDTTAFLEIDLVVDKKPEGRLSTQTFREAAPPDISTLQDEGCTTAIYPRSSLSPSLDNAFAALFSNPPLIGVAYGCKLEWYGNGLRVMGEIIPVDANGASFPLDYVPLIPLGPDDRQDTLDSQLKGLGNDPIWRGPGLKESDRKELEARESDTQKLLANYDNVRSEEAASQKSFSAALGFLAKEASLPLVYKVNPNDDRIDPGGTVPGENAIAFKDLFHVGSGYTAREEDGVLVISDELNILPNPDVGPLAAVIETFHRKDSKHSLFDRSEEARLTPLYLEDLRRFYDRAKGIEKPNSWDEMLVRPIWLSENDSELMKAAKYLVPIIQRLSPSDWRQLAKEGSMTLPAIKGLDNLAEFENGLLSESTVSHSRKLFDILYQGSSIDKAEIVYENAEGSASLALSFYFRNGDRNLVYFSGGAWLLAPDDPIVKQFPPQKSESQGTHA